MDKEDLTQELKKLKKESKDYSHYELKNEGYRVAMMDAIDLVKKLTTPDVLSSAFLVQHKETLINYGLFSDRKKAENYINNNTDLFGIQEIEIS